MSVSFDQTLDVISSIQQATTEVDICSALTHHTGKYGLDRMIAGTMPAQRARRPEQEEHLLIAGFPGEWLHRYLEHGYVHTDPVIQRIKSDMSPFEWSEAVQQSRSPPSDTARRVIDEARCFNLNVGFAVPMITLDGQVAAVSLAGERMELPPLAKGMISMISSFAIGRAMELRSRMSKRKRAMLTPREIECLKWAAAGKSEWEISVILSISQHTADKHLANAHRKLQAATRPQAVANAIRWGLIS